MSLSAPPLRHAWRECICVGRAPEILTAPVQEQLRRLQKEIGYRRVRFHASFQDELAVVAADPDGSVRYRWTLVDQIYDFLVGISFDPIVELNPMPAAIASGETTFSDYEMNVTPPSSWRAWEDLCHAAASHFVERHGLPRIKNWLFEVWNEPNLNGQFWTGSDEDYYQLYAASVRGLKRVHPDLKVGAPACAGTAMELPFLRWCREHGVPVDFVSTHNYPMDEYGKWPRREGSPHAPGRAFLDEFKHCRAALDADGFAGLPNIVTEWNTQHCSPEGKAMWVGTSGCSRLEQEALEAASQPCHHILQLPITDGVVRLPFRLRRDEVLFAELSPPRLGADTEGNETHAARAALDRALQYPGAARV